MLSTANLLDFHSANSGLTIASKLLCKCNWSNTIYFNSRLGRDVFGKFNETEAAKSVFDLLKSKAADVLFEDIWRKRGWPLRPLGLCKPLFPSVPE